MRRTTICRSSAAELIAVAALLLCPALSAQDTTQTPPPAPPAQDTTQIFPQQVPSSHVVAKGETLWAIAQMYFDHEGDAYTPSKLAIDLAGQVITNARITVRKLALFKYSLLLFGFGVLVAAAAMAIAAWLV